MDAIVHEFGRVSVSGNAKRRGFTLVEMMIVVAIVGVLAVIAVLGFRKYLNYAQTSEVKGIFSGMKVGEQAYQAEMLIYLGCSTNVNTDFYPQGTGGPNDVKWAWQQPTNPEYPCYRLLNVQTDSPVRFGYAVVTGVWGSSAPPSLLTNTEYTITGWPPVPANYPVGQPWFVMQAKNNRSGTGDTSYDVWFVTSSFSGEIMGFNDGS